MSALVPQTSSRKHVAQVRHQSRLLQDRPGLREGGKKSNVNLARLVGRMVIGSAEAMIVVCSLTKANSFIGEGGWDGAMISGEKRGATWCKKVDKSLDDRRLGSNRIASVWGRLQHPLRCIPSSPAPRPRTPYSALTSRSARQSVDRQHRSAH